MAVAFNADFNGPGLLLGGLAWNPDDEPATAYHLDGLGTLTFGFVWWLKSVWEPCDEDCDASWDSEAAPETTWDTPSSPSTDWNDGDCECS